MDQTLAQKQAAYAAAGIALPTPVPPTPTTINSTNTGPVTPIPYVTPTPTPTYPVSTLDTSVPTPPALPTPAETSANDLTTQLKNLNESLVGKTAYQTEQNTAAGVDTAQQTITDLSASLTGLQNEAKAIPIQLQQDATGRGITSGGLAPIQQEKLNQNAIKALTVSTLLEAAKGNLVTAQAKADAAVTAKYGPIQEKITAATSNLNLILNSPEYTLEEKNRAQAQLDIQNKKQADLDKAKADTTAVSNTAISAAQNTATFKPTTEYPTVATALTAIAAAATPVQASLIASQTGLMKQPDAQTAVVEVNGRKVLIDSNTGNTIKDLGAVTTAPVDDTKNSNTTISNLSSYLAAGQKLADGKTPVLDATGKITAAAWKAMKSNIPANQITDVIQAYAALFGNNKGTAASGYGFSQAEQEALTKGLPAS